MTTTEAKEKGLKDNGYALATTIGSEGHCRPAACVVRDGDHKGTLFAWDGHEWVVVDLEEQECKGTFTRLAVVTLRDESMDDGDMTMSPFALASDYECPGCEWVVDADYLDRMREEFGDSLVVCWEQE